MTRKKRITLDFFSGMSARALAEREGISIPRIYQLIDDVLKWAGAAKNMRKETIGLLIFRRETLYRLPWDEVPDTPEQFYWNTLKHNRVKENFDHPDELHHPPQQGE